MTSLPCERCGRPVDAIKLGGSAAVLCGACAGAASLHPEQMVEPPPEAWENWGR